MIHGFAKFGGRFFGVKTAYCNPTLAGIYNFLVTFFHKMSFKNNLLSIHSHSIGGRGLAGWKEITEFKNSKIATRFIGHGSSRFTKPKEPFWRKFKGFIQNPFAQGGRVKDGLFKPFGWGAGIRTPEWRLQRPLPYRLATPQRLCELFSHVNVSSFG